MSLFKNNHHLFAINTKNEGNGMTLMSSINDESVSVAFFDPQYRGILDQLQYGNEGEKRGKERCSLPQMSNQTIISFIQEINRTLKK